MEGEHVWHFVFGRSDANEQLLALYHDPRPTSRLFCMAFTGDEWTMHASWRLDRNNPQTAAEVPWRTGHPRISSDRSDVPPALGSTRRFPAEGAVTRADWVASIPWLLGGLLPCGGTGRAAQ
jgi:hypothetical protein